MRSFPATALPLAAYGRRKGRLASVALLLMACACTRAVSPSVEACAVILARRIPAARVVASGTDASAQTTLDFEVGAWWRDAQRGRLACVFEEHAGGGLRLRTATLDGVAFTDNERTVVNADLLLADMRRMGTAPGARRD
jgi:hypothetical protein